MAKAKAVPTATLTDARSHWITLDGRDDIPEKEELYLRITTEWRGAPVVAEVSCTRRRNGGWSSADVGTVGEWHCYVKELRETRRVRGHDGAHCTDTARSRVAEWVL